MGSDVAEIVQLLQHPSGVKVHSSMCWELMKILDKIIYILPAIESAHPGGRSGIQELCSLNNAIDKARLVIQHCAESSKLYLAINGDSILLRCERIRNTLNKSLSQIQDMVPVLLAAQIAEIINYVRDAKFTIDSREGEAGKIMLDLLKQTDPTKETEVEAFKIAALRLNISSPKALLIERRSIEKLHHDVHGTDCKKEKILNCLLYLLRKYGKQVMTDVSEWKENVNPDSKPLISHSTSTCDSGKSGNEPPDQDEAHADLQRSDAPHEEFQCPLKLMLDPVVIRSGQAYERMWIKKWFCEGNNTCPKTQRKLSNFSMVPNSCMKHLNSNWCNEHCISSQDPFAQPKPAAFSSCDSSDCSSITSLNNVSARLLDGKTGDNMVQSDHSNVLFASSYAGCYSDLAHVKGVESLTDNFAQMFSWSDEYRRYHTFTYFSQDMYLKFLFQLSDLPSETQGKAVEELKFLMESNEEICSAMLSNGFIEALMNFLKNAHKLSDVQALKTGVKVFLSFVSCIRVDIQALAEDAFQLLTSLFKSEISTEALMIMQMLSHHPGSLSNIEASSALPFIVNFLDSKGVEFVEVPVKILCDLSSYSEIRPHILSSGCISNLVPLLRKRRLAEHCIKILRNLCEMEEARVVIAQTNGCLASIAELLDIGNKEVQEHAVIILHSLCSHSSANCELVMNEEIILYLVSISVNGNAKAKEFSMKLLHMLRDLKSSDSFQSSESQSEPIEISESPSECVKSSESSCSQSEWKAGLIEESNKSSNKRQPSYSSSGFFARKLKFFSKNLVPSP